MISTNGKPYIDHRAELAAKRRSNRILVESIREKRLQRIAAVETRRDRLYESMTVDWVSPYLDMLDRYRRDPEFSGPSSYWQRRKGRNYPIFQSEQELALLRAPARVLCSVSSYAIGMLEGLTSYVIGSGYTYRPSKRKRERSNSEEMAIEALADACQVVIDDFIEDNEWYGGEQPSIEEEFLWRSCEDGESILVHYDVGDGKTEVRTAEPEQLTCPPGESSIGDWSFGVLTERDDIQKPLKYYLQWGDTAADGEEYGPDEITHFRRNVKRSIKRGLTDFSFDTLDALDLAGRLRTNLGDAAAQQASIVGVRQHTGGTQAEITAFVEGDKDFDTRDQLTGTATPTRRFRRGGWEDMPDGMQYVNGPIAQSQPIHLQVLQSLLRSAGVRWNAPEWLPSADASGSNYAQSLTAESPFVKTVLRRQRAYKAAFTRTMWVVLTNAAKAGKIYAAGRTWTIEEIRREIDILTEAVSPETRNKLQEAQTAALEIPLGVESRQRYTQSQGRDWDQVSQDNEQYLAETGGGGAGLPLPGDPFGGGPSVGGQPRNALGESLFESTDEMLEAREGLVKKIITDKNGVKRTVYVKGGGNDGSAKKGSGMTEKPSPAKRPTVDSTLAHVEGLRNEFTTQGLLDFATAIHGHTVAELKEIKAKLGIKASGSKAEMAKKIAERAIGGGQSGAPAKAEKKVEAAAKVNAGKAENAPPMPAGKSKSLHDDILASALAEIEKTRNRPTLPALYDQMKVKNPDLQLSQFHDALRDLQDQKKIVMMPFTQPFATMKDPQKALFHDREVKYYVDVLPGAGQAKPEPKTVPSSTAKAKDMLADMTADNHAKLVKLIDDTHEASSASEFSKFAEDLIGTKISGSKNTVKQELRSFIDRLRVSRAQTDGF